MERTTPIEYDKVAMEAFLKKFEVSKRAICRFPLQIS
jgi:hypothetical protein